MRRLRASARVRVRISMGFGRDAKTSRTRWHRYIIIVHETYFIYARRLMRARVCVYGFFFFPL